MYWMIILSNDASRQGIAIGRTRDLMQAVKTTLMHNVNGIPTVLVMPN